MSPEKFLDSSKIEIFEIRPGDVIIVKANQFANETEKYKFLQCMAELKQLVPQNRLFVLDKNTEIKIIRPMYAEK